MRIYGNLEKWDKQEDGSVLVQGIASSETLDSDGEIVEADAMRAALPDYLKWSNVREMHQPSAVGKATRAEVCNDGKTRIEALVVDSEAVKKIITGVYKGFSIAGEVLAKTGKQITRLVLKEISLVDRPANPEAVFGVWKADSKVVHTKHMTINTLLGLAETATDQEIADAFAARIKPPDNAELLAKIEKLEKAAATPPPTPPAPEPNKALESRLDELAKAMESMKAASVQSAADLEKRAKRTLVDEATRDGKVIPLSDESIDKMPMDVLRELVTKTEKTVPMSKRAMKPLTDEDREKERKGSRDRAIDNLNRTVFAKLN